jgi:hypothetical protein
MRNTNVNDRITKTLDKYGAFFAFSNEQFDKKKKEGVQYVDLGAGLIGPKENAQKIADGIEAVTKGGIADEIATKTPKEIMWDAFANYECQIVGSPNDAIDALENYPFTEKEIKKEFGAYWDYCVDNDLF